jgi:hypothetical protein
MRSGRIYSHLPDARVDPAPHSAIAEVISGRGTEPGFEPPSSVRLDSTGGITLGPFAVALVYG